ncbi:peroxidase family protein [Nonomuraea gerenzanensis]|uniref:Myeloperoxidase, thyroid peroxidase, cyclooxygenase catalytic domain n=1 Tax=Nonomuraea gerenzanensis TaxID=93944 RepID=A0A1M4EBB1_9ACTN|nr:heme peroxidase family protein [Nonomuraea gerenzanensis]UBU18263.1 heme peroxidase family protein [Nonomuraea gerenzanensis]SBO96080.1 Myeloperoxidase, thyroid peroxidase, cyclooxygenase catalytic domain [Nonomuraea gerenzanensis]
MERHQRTEYYIVNEGVYYYDQGKPICEIPSTRDEMRRFRFSRLFPRNLSATDRSVPEVSPELAAKLADAMTLPPAEQSIPDQPDSDIPAGYTYVGQFVDHDLTADRTRVSLGTQINIEDLLQGRSPALDLDCLYGLGPDHPDSAMFYQRDRARLLMGRTSAVPGLDAQDGFDLPRLPFLTALPGTALIPDHRNDENLAVAQVHLAFIRFHNKVIADLGEVGTPSVTLFEKARELVVKHYQWMLRHDFLPRIVKRSIVDDVFTNGRRFFEAPGYIKPGDTPTMPVEFSVAAFRLGHSMIRGGYEWNAFFNFRGARPPEGKRIGPGSLELLFDFSGTSGSRIGPLTSTNPLPSNWIADFRRLFRLTDVPGGDPGLAAPADGFNVAKRIDTRLVEPLRELPEGAIGAPPGESVEPIARNLAFRNFMRAGMVSLASGQQAAKFLQVPQLADKDILDGNGAGANFRTLSAEEQDVLVKNTPLWLYVLREAELHGGILDEVGGRIVAEVFHRAMEGSRYSIVTDPSFRPTLGPEPGSFGMPHLLLYAFEGRADRLAPAQ